MPKIKNGKSKRMTSRQTHKIERKKREHRRDLRKAAKAMKKSGFGPKRTKKSRELAKLALKVSNAHPDKEAILQRVLKTREDARLYRAKQREKIRIDGDEDHTLGKCANEKSPCQTLLHKYKKSFTYIPLSESNNFAYQFNKILRELVFPISGFTLEVPSAAFVLTLDARCAVQCIPWGLLDAIVHDGCNYSENKGTRKVLVLFAITKIDLISIPALVTQISLLAYALRERYENGNTDKHFFLPKDVLTVAFCPVSIRFDKTLQHFIRLLRRFLSCNGCSTPSLQCNLDRKLCTFVAGLPNTGRRALCRALLQCGTDSCVSIVPVSAAQLQVVTGKAGDSDNTSMKLAFPNAKEITLLQFPEDSVLMHELSTLSGADVVWKPLAFVERMVDPELVGCMLFAAVLDKVGLAQGFCQPGENLDMCSDESECIKEAKKFFRNFGHTVKKEKGFYVSPLFVSNAGTMGKVCSSSLTASVSFTSRQQSTQTTLLDASFSNATPNKLVRISSVVTPSCGKRKRNMSVRRIDSHNAMKLGARTFIREICQGKNVPWAVMRPPTKKCLTKEEVEIASLVFDLFICCGKKDGEMGAGITSSEHFALLLRHLTSLLKQYLVLLPHNVVEFDPDCIIAPTHKLNAAEDINEEAGSLVSGGESYLSIKEYEDETEEGTDED